MTINRHTKVATHAAPVSSDSGASQGGRKATEQALRSAPRQIPPGSDSEVVPRARRRMFGNADKRRILQAANLCTQPGKVGAPMRSEGPAAAGRRTCSGTL